MIEIRETGSYFNIDKDGFIVNPTSFEKIQEDWLPLVKAVIEEYKKNQSDSLHSIYLRGSVAKGEAIKNVSDIDLFAYINLEKKDIDRRWTTETEKVLIKKFPFVCGIELGVNPLSLAETHMILLNQSLCIFGPSVKVEKIKPGKDSMLHAPDFQNRIDWFAIFLEKKDSDEEVKNRCIWLMKGLLRVGSELVMERSQKYTRDLYRCYEMFSQYYPEKKSDMREVLHYALNPTTDKNKLKSIMDSLAPFLLVETKKVI